MVLAEENGIGTAAFRNKLDAAKNQEIRDTLASGGVGRAPSSDRRPNGAGKERKRTLSGKAALRFAIDSLIEDQVLRDRCRDLLLARGKFDRPINQATQVLEDRIRKKAEPDKRLTGENLVGYSFNEDISKTKLQVASGDADDQRGFTQILRGIVPAFRNITHHHVVDSFSREDAMRICGFIDLLLRVVDSSKKVS